MLFQEKIDRAQKWLRERSGKENAEDSDGKKGREDENDMELEKGDMPAMIFSALLTILPVCILVLLVMVSALLFVVWKH